MNQASETKAEHTPEPWHISEKQIGETLYRCEIISASGQRVLLQEVESRREHNVLVRIVACVNACAGLPTKDLVEDKDALRLAFHYQDKHDELRAQLTEAKAECGALRAIVGKERLQAPVAEAISSHAEVIVAATDVIDGLMAERDLLREQNHELLAALEHTDSVLAQAGWAPTSRPRLRLRDAIAKVEAPQ